MKGFITCVVVIAVVALGLAFYRNWIVVEKAPAPGKDSTQINITVDRDKARDDLKQARQQTRELVQKARESTEDLINTTTLKGEIMEVNRDKSELTLLVEDQNHVVRVDKDATIQHDQAKVGFADIMVGDRATIKVKEEDGVKVAHFITINPDD